MFDTPSSGELLSKFYEEGYKLIEITTTNTYQWPVTRVAIIVVLKKSTNVYEVTKTTTLAT